MRMLQLAIHSRLGGEGLNGRGYGVDGDWGDADAEAPRPM